MPKTPVCWTLILTAWLILALSPAAGAAAPEAPGDPPDIGFSQDIGAAMVREASKVREDLARETRSLFQRAPLGWNWQTIKYLNDWTLGLPARLPAMAQLVLAHGRVLGFAGSLLILVFVSAVLYSLMGQRRLVRRFIRAIQVYQHRLPERAYPFVVAAFRILVAPLIPLFLLGAYALIRALITYEAPWFTVLGRLLLLWSLGVLVIGLLREALTKGLFTAATLYGPGIFRLARLALLYALVGIGLVWSAAAFELRPDVLAFAQFVIAISIATVLFLLHLKKAAFLSFIPEMPYRPHQSFMRLLDRWYFPLVLLAFLAALLWCMGYRAFGREILVKIYASIGAYLAIILIFHACHKFLVKRQAGVPPEDEAGQGLFDSLHSLLLYTTVVAVMVVVLDLLELLHLLRRLLSIPVLTLGGTSITLWTIISVGVILAAFVYASRLLRAYLDYRIYPRLGIDTGLGFVLNTLIKYLSFALGVLISLQLVGADLRFMLVFAGAVGIGVGLGMQNLAANIISGFTIIFGGKIRKGDWIEAGGTMGEVTDIYLRATRVRNRNNVEYLIPNTELIANTIVNYSLSSPFIRTEVAVGVSYDADPRKVEQLLLEVAAREPMVEKVHSPQVRFAAYGESSIDFELLIWIDVRRTPLKLVRSNIYFAAFEALKAAGIEIPFPQRDLHIRSDATRTALPASG
jgi:small-conductance mechanosensitive channel